jgi:tetraacyldisaccharide-1-P 4'-kinase
MLNRYGALLTTEKDWINTGDSAAERVYWLKIRIEIDDETGFIKASQKSKVKSQMPKVHRPPA